MNMKIVWHAVHGQKENYFNMPQPRHDFLANGSFTVHAIYDDAL